MSPKRCAAANGATNPELISRGVNSRFTATAANPKVVASAKGMANHANPPTKNPGTTERGRDAIARCQ